jgi:hypothetical protein
VAAQSLLLVFVMVIWLSLPEHLIHPSSPRERQGNSERFISRSARISLACGATQSVHGTVVDSHREEKMLEPAMLLEIEKLRRASLAALRQKHREVFQEETRCRHREHLFRRIASARVAEHFGTLRNTQTRNRLMAVCPFGMSGLRTRERRGTAETRVYPLASVERHLLARSSASKSIGASQNYFQLL